MGQWWLQGTRSCGPLGFKCAHGYGEPQTNLSTLLFGLQNLTSFITLPERRRPSPSGFPISSHFLGDVTSSI